MIPVTGSTVPGNPACNINGFSHLVEDNIFKFSSYLRDNADISHGREYFTSGITRKQVIPRMILFHHGFSPPSECRMSDRAEFALADIHPFNFGPSLTFCIFPSHTPIPLLPAAVIGVKG